MAEILYFTEEGLKKLKDELQNMISVQRPAASAAIAEAREKGDLSENAEYDAAREAQGMLEMKISKLQDVLSNARVLDTSKVDLSKAAVLTKVRVNNAKLKKEFVYTLVSESEANLKEMKISIKSPIGAALLGKSVGDKVEIHIPAGVMELDILEISI
ncbi:MAG: transcription elongation factor GreA [Bacteroidetes bacterium]|jgi:transcription elongation factor GreA|nr:transcription elongation factor GreA [Bacteroidota bacterium]MBP7257859.1 transcription elongation factor GreA [Chitinophagales bacterium]MBK7505255.1 transcription elongation factor GreA [Bacteroidota bacterium]MBK7640434.1 transcription elongation factor GreA [Bacteroidota bacterium]MBK9355024.1 transcription elongation factor GreA [Bacteroidota bacterium]